MPETESREMYLKSIYELSSTDELVPVSLLAKRLGVSPVSATEMVKRLEGNGAITHQPYKGVALTESGLKRALIVIRRQRLWGRFLADRLKIRWSQVYDLSCRLEHATDETVSEALAEYLGNPTTCPYGHPIPAPDGSVEIPPAIPLNEVAFDQEVEIIRIDQPELILCEYLEEKNLLPGTTLAIIDEAPFNGPFTLQVNGKEISLGREISVRILVQPSSS